MTMWKNTNSTLPTHQQGEPVKKLTYSPPTLTILETDEIAGGTQSLQEADGAGFVS